MDEGRLFQRQRRRGPTEALERLLLQAPLLTSTMGYSVVALGLASAHDAQLHALWPSAVVGFFIAVAQLRWFRLSLVAELVLLASLLAAVSSFSDAPAAADGMTVDAAAWVGTGAVVSLVGRAAHALARRVWPSTD